MLGKLFKYEFKSTVRVLGVVYLAILVCAAVFGLVARAGVMHFGVLYEIADSADIATETPNISQGLATTIVIFAFIYMLLIVAMFVLTAVMIISRFYKNLLQGEGYLMHTLPVPTWMLVASKTLSALLWIVLGFAVVLLSGGLLLLTAGVWTSEWATAVWSGVHELLSQLNLSSVLTLILLIIEIVSFILMIYFCLAIGNIANRHKIAAAFLTFVGVWIAIALISLVAQHSLFGFLIGTGYFEGAGMSPELTDESMRGFMRSVEIRQLIMYLAYSVLFFFGTTLTLKKRLNLE